MRMPTLTSRRWRGPGLAVEPKGESEEKLATGKLRFLLGRVPEDPEVEQNLRCRNVPASKRLPSGFVLFFISLGSQDKHSHDFPCFARRQVSDLRRSFVGWLKKAELETKQHRSELRPIKPGGVGGRCSESLAHDKTAIDHVVWDVVWDV